MNSVSVVDICVDCLAPLGSDGECFNPECVVGVPPPKPAVSTAQRSEPLAWTTDKPTEPGWYVFKEKPTAWGAFVEIAGNGRGDRWMCGNGFTCDIKDGCYCGPLPEMPK